MSDLFHEEIPDEFIQAVFSVIERAGQHTFQVLTKRHERLLKLARDLPWPPNIWMGVSVENQRWAIRAEYLKEVPAAVKFLSVEPLLGPVHMDFRGLDWVIVGGESGPRARLMRPEWVRCIRSQCEAASVLFFFKQWGAFNEAGSRVGKGRAGRSLDGQTWDRMPNAYVVGA